MDQQNNQGDQLNSQDDQKIQLSQQQSLNGEIGQQNQEANNDVINNQENQQFQGSFQNLDEYNELDGMLDFQENMQLQYNLIFNSDTNPIFQNFDNPIINNDMYFQNILNNNNQIEYNNKQNDFDKTKVNEQSFNTYLNYDDNKINNSTKENNNNLKQMNNTNQQKQEKIDIDQYKSINMKKIEEYILNDPQLGKKYKKRIACPMCMKSNLEMFEINQEESLFMCTNSDCNFPFENDDLLEFTFQTKFKKRVLNKLKNKIHFKYNSPIEIFFEVEDIQLAIQALEQSQNS